MSLPPTADYRPLPKQMMAHRSPANELLYGGAAGPGKSHFLRMEALHWCMRVPGLQAYLFRRTFPELEKNHILVSQAQFPKSVGVYKQQAKRWDFNNGSRLFFASCQYENDVFQYQGAEIHLLLLDELTTFTEFQYDYLRGRLRCALDIPAAYRHKVPGIVAATNPGGVGHAFVKSRWVDFAPPMTLKRAPDDQGGMVRIYIPGLLEDNPLLMLRDPNYAKRLDALPEPYRSAYRDGDWNIFLGQAFEFHRDKHVIPAMPIPAGVSLYMTFDWGYGAPFSLGWWWEDADGRLIRCAEWYGFNGTPGQGLRLTDPEIAAGILEREERMGIKGRPITRLAGPDCFSKKPDYRGGGQGPSTAEVFAGKGVVLVPGDPTRATKIRRFRERLDVPEEGMRPMLQVYDTCEQFIRTIPLLQTDRLNVEDIDTTGEDHIYDEACHVCMLRAPKTDGLTAGLNLA